MMKKNTCLRANLLNGSVKICRSENNKTVQRPQSQCFNGFLRKVSLDTASSRVVFYNLRAELRVV